MKLWQFIILGALIGAISFSIYHAHEARLLPAPPPAATNTLPMTATTSSSTVRMTGTYLGLLDAKDRYDRTYMYLLLSDQAGIERIDLRPLYGINYTDITGRLGLQQGEAVTVSGHFRAGGFAVATITPDRTAVVSSTTPL